MKQSIIPGVSLRDNEALTLVPRPDVWLYTLTVFSKRLGALRAQHWMTDKIVMSIAYSANIALQQMMQKMRRDIEQEVLRLVLG